MKNLKMFTHELKRLTVIIPIFNEERTLRKLIKTVEDVPLQIKKEIILIDDGSDDKSREMLGEYKDKHKIILFGKNSGKGTAVKRGFQEATGDIVLIQDADLEYNPQEYPRLIKPIMDGEADVVYGSRFLKMEETNRNNIVYRHGYLAGKALNWLSNILSGIHLTDMYTCYKVFSKNAIRQIRPHLVSKRFGIDPELTAWVGKMNLRIVEVPITYTGRTYGEGKKINWKDGLAAVWHIIRFNLFTRK